MLNAIDVSDNNPEHPDYTGYDIVIIKATEGSTYVNKYLPSQYGDAVAQGKRIWLYHFPNIYGAPTADQARFFADTIAPYLKPGMAVCLDWEWYNHSKIPQLSEKPTAEEIAARDAIRDQEYAIARQYRDDFDTALRGLLPEYVLPLYCDTNIWKNVDKTSNGLDGLWIADYGATAGQPRIQDPWIGHQYAASPVDKSVFKFSDLAEYDAWARRRIVTPQGQTVQEQLDALAGQVAALGDRVKRLEDGTAPPQPQQPEQPQQPADDGQDRHWPADYPYTDTLTVQRLVKAANDDVLTDDQDYRHRLQALVSAIARLDAIGKPSGCAPMPSQGESWHDHFRRVWILWQQSDPRISAGADGIPGPKSVYMLAQSVGLKFWDADKNSSASPFDGGAPAAPTANTPGRIASPAPGYGITTPYGTRKAGLWPSKGYHTGDDYAATEGTRAVAVVSGTVTVIDDTVLGCIAVLRGDNGRNYWYCHTQRGSRQTGRKNAGDWVANVGQTGTGAQGPHLHFEDNASATVWGTDRKPSW